MTTSISQQYPIFGSIFWECSPCLWSVHEYLHEFWGLRTSALPFFLLMFRSFSRNIAHCIIVMLCGCNDCTINPLQYTWHYRNIFKIYECQRQSMSDQTHIWSQNMVCKSSRRLSKYPKFPKIFKQSRIGWVQLVEYKYEFRIICSAIIVLWLSSILLPYHWLELGTWWLVSSIAYVRFSHSHAQNKFRFSIFASYHHYLSICLQTTVYPQLKPCSSTLVSLQCCWL